MHFDRGGTVFFSPNFLKLRPSGLYRGYPAMAAMDWWGQEKWDPIPQLRGEPKPEPLPEIKAGSGWNN